MAKKYIDADRLKELLYRSPLLRTRIKSKGGKQMKAPDIIHIITHNGETLSSKWTTISFRDFENTEYIRKGTLLEYFHQRIEELNSPLNGVFGSTERDNCNERISELLLLIDKLNEM